MTDDVARAKTALVDLLVAEGVTFEPELLLDALREVRLEVSCPTCGHGKQITGWCEFDGTGDGCTRVTEFTGGHASGAVRWKTRTYDGGWIGDEEFSPGDTILRREDGSFSVGSYKAWAQRLTKALGCPDCSDGRVSVRALSVWAENEEGQS